ncbi:MAG: hypothetical protein KA297_07240 [Kofleriaceae bacterium]|nr:hypothetical protein [Kofleriaceae bacterium]
MQTHRAPLHAHPLASNRGTSRSTLRRATLAVLAAALAACVGAPDEGDDGEDFTYELPEEDQEAAGFGAAAARSCSVSTSDLEGGSASSIVSINISRDQGRSASLGGISWGVANDMTFYGGGNNKVQVYWQTKRGGSWRDAFGDAAWSANHMGEGDGSAFIGQAMSWGADVTGVRLRVRTSWDTFGSDPSKTCYLSVL